MQLFIDSSIIISKSAEFEVLREKTAELKKLNEQLRDEVDDLHVKYNDMQSSLDKEISQRKEDISEIKLLIIEETTKREECISHLRNEIETKEQKLKDVTSCSSNSRTLRIDVQERICLTRLIMYPKL